MTENTTVTTPPSPSTTNDRLWNVLCHLSPFLGAGLILPLIVYLVTRDDPNSSIPAHAKEALNFHISLFIYGTISALLIFVFIGILLIIVISLAALILSVVAAIKASKDEVYQYPLTIRLVK